MAHAGEPALSGSVVGVVRCPEPVPQAAQCFLVVGELLLQALHVRQHRLNWRVTSHGGCPPRRPVCPGGDPTGDPSRDPACDSQLARVFTGAPPLGSWSAPPHSSAESPGAVAGGRPAGAAMGEG
jgi:hypothetical protein